ncbi:protein TonB [Alteromonadaceae bacterium 2753L.S.0a.02]|nr:protein TonB [Alteromonadaceae bacterium 2753L.S.0a.02]
MADISETASGDRLSFTLFLAAAIHAIIIFGVSFSVNKGEKIAPTLNITLATHKSQIAPEKADFLAQFDQLASGSADEVREITSDKAAEIEATNIKDVNPLPQRKATSENQNTTQILATQRPREHQVAQQPDPDTASHSEQHEGEELDAPLLSPEIASLRAKLARDRQELANKPRIRRLTSVSTKTSYDAAYLNDWTQKVEAIGNENFPKEALANAIYGSLRVAVLIDRFGKVQKVEILQSSGHRILDDATQQIVRLSSPFAPLPKEMLKHADQLEIIRTWRFEITGMSTSR